MVSLGQKLKKKKHARNHATRLLELLCAKKPLEKEPNIKEMGEF